MGPIAQLDPESTVLITPNRRLSATIIKHYNALQLAAHKTTWPSLRCFPFNLWIKGLWENEVMQQLDAAYQLLSPEQEHIIWEEIIRQSNGQGALLQLSATAEAVKSAWGLLKQWQVALSDPRLSTTANGQSFLAWAQTFQETCEQNHWLDGALLIEKVCHLIDSQQMVPLEKTIYVVGFTELSPLQKQIFLNCEKNGIAIYYQEAFFSDGPLDKKAHRIALKDTDTEIETMARWARALIDAPQKNNRPPVIGCVVPALETIRDRIEQVFLQVFKDRLLEGGKDMPFNISAGKQLISYPIIYAALQWLMLPLEVVPYAKLSYLLRSPFLGEAEQERFKRAEFDNQLRQANLAKTTLAEFLHRDEKTSVFNESPLLGKRLARFLEYFNDLPKKLSLKEWAAHFNELLLILAWPGERSLNSHEYQITQRWLALLNDFQTFHWALPPLEYHQALHYLNYVAETTIYQPQSPDAPIQILGTLEAAGLSFDYLWALGMDDATWPPTARPNPFVPPLLQKKLHMPHASAERELAYSMGLTDQLLQSAHVAIFSHAKNTAETELRPSALIAHLPELDIAALPLSVFIKPAELIFNCQQRERFQDEKAPRVEATEMMGGVAILKHQAACPFKAFATVRLNAATIAPPTLGLRYQDRGMIIHKALEKFWREIKTQAHLIAQSDEVLQSLLIECIQSALETTRIHRSKPPRYLSLEKKRLHRLLWDWLTLEKKRPDFKVVAHEHEWTACIGPLSLTLRIDRIDELEDGSQFIIDYKTGKHNFIKDWFSERPDEPQLPLYCTTLTDTIHAMAFAEIHAETLGFKGTSKENIAVQGVKALNEIPYVETSSWEAQTAAWKTIFVKLADDFYHGNAAVSPKNGEMTCQQCDLRSLCRAPK